MNKLRQRIALAAAVADLGGGLAVAPAAAAPSGALDDVKRHLSGSLTDTGNNDGKGAAFRIEAIYADGGDRHEEVWNTGGYGATVPIGEYNFASSLVGLWMDESTLVKRADGNIDVGYCAEPYKLGV